MNRIEKIYTEFCLGTQTVAPTLNGFQGLKRCIQYMDIYPHKNIFYPSNSYEGSNSIRLAWTGNQVEDCTTQNCLEWNQYTDHSRIINRIHSLLGIIHDIIDVVVCCKLYIQPHVASESTDG